MPIPLPDNNSPTNHPPSHQPSPPNPNPSYKAQNSHQQDSHAPRQTYYQEEESVEEEPVLERKMTRKDFDKRFGETVLEFSREVVYINLFFDVFTVLAGLLISVHSVMAIA